MAFCVDFYISYTELTGYI